MNELAEALVKLKRYVPKEDTCFLAVLDILAVAWMMFLWIIIAQLVMG